MHQMDPTNSCRISNTKNKEYAFYSAAHKKLPSFDTDLFKSLEIPSLTIPSLELSNKNEHYGTHPHPWFKALEN